MMKLIALTARTAAFAVVPDGAKFTLAQPREWSLSNASGESLRSGTTHTVPLFIEGLQPDQSYVLACGGERFAFRTKLCAGLVHAETHGVRPESSDNTEAFGRALAAVPENGTLLVPPGRHLTRPLFLKPNMTLLIPEGAEIVALADRAGWPILPARDKTSRVIGTWEGLPEASFASVLTGIDCDGLVITGRGVIDGGGAQGDWWQWPKETRDGARRPRTVFIAHSDDVILSGVTVRNSPSWTVHPYRCQHLTAAALNIENPPDSPNTDGFNPESCEDVQMIGLNFSVGDDCIAIKSGKRSPDVSDHIAPTRRVRISHCRMARGHGAVVIGSEMSGDVTDVDVSNCEFVGTDRGLRLKTRRGRGGLMASIHMRNVSMERVLTPLAINAFYFCDPDGKSDAVQSRIPAPVDDTTPRVKDITMSDVTATGVTLAAAAILGLPEAPIQNVRLHNYAVSYDPAAKPDVALMALGVAPVRHASVVSEFAEVHADIKQIEHQEDHEPC
ncbi:Polygalacturonase [Actibacterium lipolyticum]|uniref:Polygalacturonase n=2 Tax=Actibacterium lipolyticum TaxID=1524263 RepID=A0A238KV02_9RHOB|nr:Polygalacturonase [Actibacterium lipolyticum]